MTIREQRIESELLTRIRNERKKYVRILTSYMPGRIRWVVVVVGWVANDGEDDKYKREARLLHVQKLN